MVDDGESVRVEVAFGGGPILSATVTASGADAFEQAFASGSQDVVQLDTTDGRLDVALDRVVYVKRFARDAKVGFGI
jgi:hypothetical protein